jgi:hypothetical protein
MLFSKSATANSLSFLVGWVVGLLCAGLIVLALGISSSDGAPSTASGWIKIVIGPLTIAAAASIGPAGLSSGDEVVVMVVFVLIASVTVAAPVILNMILGSKAEHTLTEMLAAEQRGVSSPATTTRCGWVLPLADR